MAIEVINSEPSSQGKGRFRYINITAPIIEINMARIMDKRFFKGFFFVYSFLEVYCFLLKELNRVSFMK